MSDRAKNRTLPPARILDCTPEEYLKDPCATPSLSASTAHKLISRSPLHAWTSHPKYGHMPEDEEDVESEDEDTKAKSNGTIIHRLLLGKGAELVVVNADSWRTKAAKEIRDEAKAIGKTPILECKLNELRTAESILRTRCKDMGFEFTGESEIPIEWYEAGPAGPVLCRSMIDHGWLEQGIVLDLKSTGRNAHPDTIARNFISYGTHIQDHAYIRAIECLRPELVGRVDLTFLYVELQPPYAVVPIVPDGAIQEIGRLHWQRAVSIWQSCLAKNEWPSYCTSRIVLEAPQYEITRHLGKEWAA